MESFQYYLGIDPSTVSTGYAVLRGDGKLIEYGLIKPDSDLDDAAKLAVSHTEISKLIRKYNYSKMAPSEDAVVTYPIEWAEEHKVVGIGCEDQFNGPNVMTLIKIARTAAMTMLIAAQHPSAEFHMIYPSSWRLLFHGSGKATKRDTIKLVNEIHGLSLKGKDNDIADAIGIAHAILLKCQGGCGQTEKK